MCPACSRPLDGDLVASGCNVVFHRSCLAAAGAVCPRCSRTQCKGNSLDLFGASFGKTLDPSAAALAARIAVGVGNEGDRDADRAGRLLAAAKLLKKQEEVEELRSRLKEELEALAAARVEDRKQQEKLDIAKRTLAKREKEVTQLRDKCAVEESRQQKLIEQMNLMRVRDTAHEYWDRMKAGNESDALKYLSTMVGIDGSSWRVLAEVSRLREYVRKQLDIGRKEATAAAGRLQSARHTMEQQQRCQAGGSSYPPAKRSRSDSGFNPHGL